MILGTNKILVVIFLISLAQIYAQFDSFHKKLKDNCKYCHVNEATEDYSNTQLWAKNFNNNNYIPYSTSTIDATVSSPLGSSKLCLSCHDGTISMGHFNLPNLTNSQIIGYDLTNSHPVSFEYDSYLALKDKDLYDPISSPSGLGGTISSDLLVDGRLECVSCHDIHGFRQEKYLLVMSNYRSKLCLTCHNK